MEAVTVQNLSFAYRGGEPLLRNLSFSIGSGETVVFAGLSGCGKTTLCRILCGVIPNAIDGEIQGSVALFGEPVAGKKLSQLAPTVGLLFQDSDDQLVCTTVEDELAFAPENLCMPPEAIAALVDETLEAFGLTALRLRDPATLSGGQKKLVALASLMTLGPKLLILDEPMSNLDGQGRALVRAQIDRLREQGRTIILVEHDLSLADYAERWIIFENGVVAEDAPPAALLARPECLRARGLWM